MCHPVDISHELVKTIRLRSRPLDLHRLQRDAKDILVHVGLHQSHLEVHVNVELRSGQSAELHADW
jgi:hypothetical protein